MIDWDIIKAEYLTTDTSYRKLSKKYNISLSQVALKAKQENWVKQKNDKSEQIGAIAISNSTDEKIDEINDLISLNNRLIKLVDRKIKGYETTGNLGPDVKSIKGLADTISGLTANVRNLKGIPTQAEKEAQKIAAGRLEIERKKLDGDEEDAKFEFVVDKKEYAE